MRIRVARTGEFMGSLLKSLLSLLVVVAIGASGCRTPLAGKPKSESQRSATGIEHRTKSIIFPSINLEEATFAQAAQYLTEQSAKVASDGVGVRVWIQKAPPPLIMPNGINIQLRGELQRFNENCHFETVCGTWSETNSLITLSMSNVPLLEVVQYVASLGGTYYSFHDDGISLGNHQCEVRLYKLTVPVSQASIRIGEKGGLPLSEVILRDSSPCHWPLNSLMIDFGVEGRTFVWPEKSLIVLCAPVSKIDRSEANLKLLLPIKSY